MTFCLATDFVSRVENNCLNFFIVNSVFVNFYARRRSRLVTQEFKEQITVEICGRFEESCCASEVTVYPSISGNYHCAIFRSQKCSTSFCNIHDAVRSARRNLAANETQTTR